MQTKQHGVQNPIAIEYVALDALKPFVDNPRHHSERNIADIKRSITRFGWTNPVIVRRADNMIIAGHGRLEAAKAEGIETVPVVYVDMSENDAKLYSIADNRTAETSEWDATALNDLIEELEAVPDIDIEGTGFDADELDNLLADVRGAPEIVEDGFDEAAPDEAASQVGDLWVLGEHHLACGDCTDKSVVAGLMTGGSAALVFTDPPYGVGIGEKNALLNTLQRRSARSLDKLHGDSLASDELRPMLTAAFTLVREVMDDCAAIYVTGPQGGSGGGMFLMMMQQVGLPVRHILFWLKNQPGFSMGRLDYEYQHEPILYTWKKTHKHYGKGQFNTSVWPIDKPRASPDHPTTKPVALVGNALLNSSKEGDAVYDPFLGSGTTLIACEQLGRRCYAVEIEPRYVDLAVRRWVAHVGGESGAWCERDGQRIPFMELFHGQRISTPHLPIPLSDAGSRADAEQTAL